MSKLNTALLFRCYIWLTETIYSAGYITRQEIDDKWARKNDLSHMSEDQVNFAEQKNLANGCKTMKKYLWKICGQQYDAEHA